MYCFAIGPLREGAAGFARYWPSFSSAAFSCAGGR
jgi:hypothetical protein